MYKLQVEYRLVPTNPGSLAEQNFPTRTIRVEEHLACRWCGYFFCEEYCAATGPSQQIQPSSGPSRIQNRTESREAEALYINYTHESSGAIFEDGSIGFHPGQAWSGAYNNTGGKIRKKPYDRFQGSQLVQAQRDRNHSDASMFEVPTMSHGRTDPLAGGGSTSRSSAYANRPSRYQPEWLHRSSAFEVPMTGGAMADGPSIPTSPAAPSASTSISADPLSTLYTLAEATRTRSTTGRNTLVLAGGQRERHEPIEEEDFDTVSLGSE